MARKPDPACDWLSLGFDTWELMGEAATVIMLRSARLAAGGTEGAHEAQRMITEKMIAGATLQRKLVSGKGGRSPEAVARATLAHYSRHVRANRRRLSK